MVTCWERVDLLALIGILGQVWCLIVSIPDLCPLSFFGNFFLENIRDRHERSGIAVQRVQRWGAMSVVELPSRVCRDGGLKE